MDHRGGVPEYVNLKPKVYYRDLFLIFAFRRVAGSILLSSNERSVDGTDLKSEIVWEQHDLDVALLESEKPFPRDSLIRIENPYEYLSEVMLRN